MNERGRALQQEGGEWSSPPLLQRLAYELLYSSSSPHILTMMSEAEEAHVEDHMGLELLSDLLHEHGMENLLKESDDASLGCIRYLLQHGTSRQLAELRNLGTETPFHQPDETTSAAGKVKELDLSIGKEGFVLEPSFCVQKLPRLCLHDVEADDGLRFTTASSAPFPPDSVITEVTDESSTFLIPSKTQTCRYFTMPGGCVRGDKCFYAHTDETSLGTRVILADIRQGLLPKHIGGNKRVSEDLSRKIFVGGLSPSVESDDLRDFFEGRYGPVLDAVVIGSQSGEYMHSRGFGFVTFKHAESVAAAVEAHYINIYGKKVEIKSAKPRSELPALDSSKADPHSPEDSQSTSSTSRIIDLDDTEVLEVSTPGSLCQPKNEISQAKWMSLLEHDQVATAENSAGAGCTSSKEANASPDSYPQSVVRSSSTSSSQGINPTWLNKFRQWLPSFLAGVSRRLKEGEWYPLSSLKGDFRATCGLELDHVALGFEKLSDFARSFPDLCRMKIVPVGRGPATHMVLLPPLPQNTPSATVYGQGRPSGCYITSRSLVDGSRSYADVACQGANVKPLPAPTTPASASYGSSAGETCRYSTMHRHAAREQAEISSSMVQHPGLTLGPPKGSSLVEGGPLSYAAVACNGTSGDRSSLPQSVAPANTSFELKFARNVGGLRLTSTNDTTNCLSGPSSTATVLADRVKNSSVPLVQVGATTVEAQDSPEASLKILSKEEWAILQQLLSRLKKNELGQPLHSNQKMADTIAPPDTPIPVPPALRNDTSQSQVSHLTVQKLREEREKSHILSEQEPKTPNSEMNVNQFTAFSHPFAGFLQETYSPYSVWDKQASGNRAMEGYNCQAHVLDNLNPSCQFYEDSPRTNHAIYGTPTGLSPATTNSLQGYSTKSGMCGICFVRRALWVASPCGHHGLCTACRDSLRQVNHDTTHCFLCNGYVERWIALH